MKPRLRAAAGSLQSMPLSHFFLDACICLFVCVCAHVCVRVHACFPFFSSRKGRDGKKWAYGDSGGGDGSDDDDDDDALAEQQCSLAVAPPPSPPPPCVYGQTLFGDGYSWVDNTDHVVIA